MPVQSTMSAHVLKFITYLGNTPAYLSAVHLELGFAWTPQAYSARTAPCSTTTGLTG
jgi:hypothetical protein